MWSMVAALIEQSASRTPGVSRNSPWRSRLVTNSAITAASSFPDRRSLASQICFRGAINSGP